MTKNIPPIEAILKKNGPCLSSTIATLLIKYGLARDAARQRISRASAPVRKLRGIRFPKRESFVYLDEHFGKDIFKESLEKALKSSNTAAGRALYGIEARGGAIPTLLFPSVSGCPVSNTKGQLLHSIVLKQLIENGLVYEGIDEPHGAIIKLHDSDLSKRQKSVLIVESIVLSILRVWLMKMGFTSNKSSIRGESPRFGPFEWNLVAPSYLTGLRDYNKGSIKNGFIVCDILLDKEVSLNDLKPFLFKCDLVINQKNQRPFIPIFVADGFEHEALDELRKRGFLLGRPKTLFGEEAANDLRQLTNTIENAAAAITNDPDSVFGLIDRMAKIEGASLNLRSVVLELIVARIYALQGYSIEIRKQVITEQGKAEIDVKAVSSFEAVFIECKAVSHGNTVKKKDIEEWKDKSLPRIEEWQKRAESLPNFRRFEFYTSTVFDKEAEPSIAKMKQRVKRPIKFLTGKDVMDTLKHLGQTSLVNIFREQFDK